MKKEMSTITISAETKFKLLKFGKRKLTSEDIIDILTQHAMECPRFLEEHI